MSCQSDASDEDAREETDHLPSHKKGKLVTYKEKHTFRKGEGFKTKRYEKESGEWVERNAPEKSKSQQFKSEASQSVCVGIGTAADKILLHYGIGAATKAEVNAEKVECETSVAEAAGLKFLDAGAEAKVGNAGAGASASPVQAQAFLPKHVVLRLVPMLALSREYLKLKRELSLLKHRQELELD